MKYNELVALYGYSNVTIDHRNVACHVLQKREKELWIALQKAIIQSYTFNNAKELEKAEKAWDSAFSTLCNAGLTVR